MRRTRNARLLSLLLLVVLVACGPSPAPVSAPSSAPPASSPPPASPSSPATVDTVAPASTEVSSTAANSALAYPQPVMERGSTVLYFDGSPLVAVPGGPFVMGHDGKDNPTHTVTVDDFWIYSVEVTNRMYALCVDAGKCSPPDVADNPSFTDAREGNKPVVGVNWQQANDYCTYAHARLPTEAEWEKTARGPDGNIYPWGNNGPECSLLNFDGCVRRTTFVGSYPDGESYYKAMDMSGNVFEWVADWYLATYYGQSPDKNPQGPETGTQRSVRSSAFNTDGYLTEAARRSSAEPDDHRPDLGFRCVVEDPSYFAPYCTTLLMYGSNAQGAGGGGETLKESCNKPVIDQLALSCTQTNVWVDANGGDISSLTGLDASHCVEGGAQMHNGKLMRLYTCSPGTPPIEVCGDCQYPKPGSASCPAGYHQEGNQCSIDQGAPGQCPAGSTYDATAMCCTVAAGQGAASELCPPGYSYIPGGSPDDPGSCVNYVAGAIQCTPDVVAFKQGCGDGGQPDCTEHPDDPACQPGACDPSKDPHCPPPGGGGCSRTDPNYPNCSGVPSTKP